MNFVAQFRVVQRLIMVCTVIWIVVVLYKTGILSSLASQLSLYARSPDDSRYFSFDINDTRIPEGVRETLQDPVMRPVAARVLHQVRGVCWCPLLAAKIITVLVCCSFIDMCNCWQ